MLTIQILNMTLQILNIMTQTWIKWKKISFYSHIVLFFVCNPLLYTWFRLISTEIRWTAEKWIINYMPLQCLSLTYPSPAPITPGGTGRIKPVTDRWLAPVSLHCAFRICRQGFLKFTTFNIWVCMGASCTSPPILINTCGAAKCP